MIRFYFNGSPNPTKVGLFLEESGLAYEPVAIDTRTGAQFSADYLAINPNGKVPAIVDGDVVVFDSNAILLYLAEKTGKFLPPASDAKGRGELLSWLMFVATGIGPYFGQAVHFKHYAPEPVPYAHDRYQYEADRHLKVVEGHLAGRDWMVGKDYSIIDMALWAWVRLVPFILGDDAWSHYPNVKRLHDAVNAHPAAARAVALKERFSFSTRMDDEVRSVIFGHLKKAG